MSIFDIKSSMQQVFSKDKGNKAYTGFEEDQFEVVKTYFSSFQMKEAQLDVRTI